VSGTIVPDLPIWAQWFAALAVPIAATVGVVIGFFNYKLTVKKRKDDLFDRRYDFIAEIEGFLENQVRSFNQVEKISYWRDEIMPGSILDFDQSSPTFVANVNLLLSSAERSLDLSKTKEIDKSTIAGCEAFISRISDHARPEARRLSLKSEMLFGKCLSQWGDFSEMTLRQMAQHINDPKIKIPLIEKTSLR
jgi:hypothetical protein